MAEIGDDPTFKRNMGFGIFADATSEMLAPKKTLDILHEVQGEDWAMKGKQGTYPIVIASAGPCVLRIRIVADDGEAQTFDCKMLSVESVHIGDEQFGPPDVVPGPMPWLIKPGEPGN